MFKEVVTAGLTLLMPAGLLKKLFSFMWMACLRTARPYRSLPAWKRRRINITLPEDVLKQIDAFAEAQGLTWSVSGHWPPNTRSPHRFGLQGRSGGGPQAPVSGQSYLMTGLGTLSPSRRWNKIIGRPCAPTPDLAVTRARCSSTLTDLGGGRKRLLRVGSGRRGTIAQPCRWS